MRPTQRMSPAYGILHATTDRTGARVPPCMGWRSRIGDRTGLGRRVAFLLHAVPPIPRPLGGSGRCCPPYPGCADSNTRRAVACSSDADVFPCRCAGAAAGAGKVTDVALWRQGFQEERESLVRAAGRHGCAGRRGCRP